MVRRTFFLLCSFGLFLTSRPSLRDRRSHGFFRFFAWEAILALILRNAPAWFRRPFSPRQLLSWFLLLGSIPLAMHGFWVLHDQGQPQGKFEDTTRLVTTGAYQSIRHPLYASLLMVTWGAFFKDVTPISGLLAWLASLFLDATARAEEVEMMRKFGAEYAGYIGRTRRFIPYLF